MRHGRYRFIIGFLAPAAILFTVFVISPFAQAFHYSLTDWTGISPEFEYVGFRNFTDLLNDSVFKAALVNNLILLAALPILTVGLALIFAFLLNLGGGSKGAGIRGIKGNTFYKLVFFLPQVLAVPVIAVIWSVILDPTRDGLVNSIVDLFGGDPIGWLSNPDFALWSLIWVLVWSNVGFYLVLFNAAMSGVPREIFEAAEIDGSGKVATFVKITLPLLWDTIQTSWVYLATLALDAYALVAVMTQGPGGPANSTQVMALQIVDNGTRSGNAGYASAMGVVLFLLTLTIAAFMLRATRRERLEY